ncbi:thioredoxin, mitochondrial [Alligator mississippiensis]|uniref:thioredoxin, mitochondrial n=1 Tax=Alligator mississippiensis TaxID=8496 RepID=UPI0028777D2D|nr:thioredoxin, mitochondrial [Alligator mississippiensis]
MSVTCIRGRELQAVKQGLKPISSQYLPARATDRSLPQPTPCPHSSSPANEVAACPGSARELRRPPGPGRSTFNIQDGEDFQDRVINSAKPVVIDFHAQWCGPCKILGPRLEKMVAKQQGKVLMAKVDIDDHTDLAIEYEAEFLLLQCPVLIRVLTKVFSLLSCLFLTNCQKTRKREANKVLWVSAVPTVLAMKNGDVVDKFVGIKDEDQLEAFLKKLIGA